MTQKNNKILCSLEKEEKFKKRFDTSIEPRKWIGFYGHTIILGDLRKYEFEDKEFEKWIKEAFDLLDKEGLSKLQKEFLTDKEIEERKNFMDDY